MEQIHTRPQRNASQNYLTCGSKAEDIDVAVLNSFNTEGSAASLNTPQAQQQFESSCCGCRKVR
jgi:hypothetical protein